MVWTIPPAVQKPWTKQEQQQQNTAISTTSSYSYQGKGSGGASPLALADAISKITSLFSKGGGGDLMSMLRSLKGGGGFGKGGGKGFKGKGGKGWGNRNNMGRSNGKPLPPGTEIDREARYSGKVQWFHKWRGFGMVELNQKGVIPNNTIFVYWKSITSDDRYPFLTEGMDVELGLFSYKNYSGQQFVRAKNVTLPSGTPICIQDDLDAQTKTFIGGQHLRYLGKLNFFDARKGFGYITMEDGYSLPEPVPKELRVDASEVNAGGKRPATMKDVQVEFGLWKNEKGVIKAYNMTLPDGIPCTREAIERREVLQGRWFTGVVVMNRWQSGFGFIKPDEKQILPPKVMAKLKEMNKNRPNSDGDNRLYFRSNDIQEGTRLRKDMKVKFLVYTDDMGAGACEIVSTELSQ